MQATFFIFTFLNNNNTHVNYMKRIKTPEICEEDKSLFQKITCSERSSRAARDYVQKLSNISISPLSTKETKKLKIRIKTLQKRSLSHLSSSHIPKENKKNILFLDFFLRLKKGEDLPLLNISTLDISNLEEFLRIIKFDGAKEELLKNTINYFNERINSSQRTEKKIKSENNFEIFLLLNFKEKSIEMAKKIKNIFSEGISLLEEIKVEENLLKENKSNILEVQRLVVKREIFEVAMVVLKKVLEKKYFEGKNSKELMETLNEIENDIEELGSENEENKHLGLLLEGCKGLVRLGFLIGKKEKGRGSLFCQDFGKGVRGKEMIKVVFPMPIYKDLRGELEQGKGKEKDGNSEKSWYKFW